LDVQCCRNAPQKAGERYGCDLSGYAKKNSRQAHGLRAPQTAGERSGCAIQPVTKNRDGPQVHMGERTKKTAEPWAWGTGSLLPAKAREQTTDDLLRRSNEKKNSRLPSQEQTGAPQKAGERRGDDLFGATKMKWRPVTPQKRS